MNRTLIPNHAKCLEVLQEKRKSKPTKNFMSFHYYCILLMKLKKSKILVKHIKYILQLSA